MSTSHDQNSNYRKKETKHNIMLQGGGHKFVKSVRWGTKTD